MIQYIHLFLITKKKQKNKKIMIRTCEIKLSLLSVINFYRDLPPPISKQCRNSMSSSTLWTVTCKKFLFFHENDTKIIHIMHTELI